MKAALAVMIVKFAQRLNAGRTATWLNQMGRNLAYSAGKSGAHCPAALIDANLLMEWEMGVQSVLWADPTLEEDLPEMPSVKSVIVALSRGRSVSVNQSLIGFDADVGELWVKTPNSPEATFGQISLAAVDRALTSIANASVSRLTPQYA